jgi:FkbM family methyltransferase
VWVFDQIFVQREYRPLDELAGVTSIMDLGANVGLASAYLLRVFPKSRVIAVEPDSENFEMLQRNLARFGDRVLPVRGAAWNACRSLRIADSKYRGGGSASVQVTAGGPGEGCVSGFDVPALMDMAAFERVSLLKVDIEGAEVMVFDESSAAWIDRVDNIAIELHDDSSFGMASPVFWRAILDRGFVCRQSGELVLCVRSTA